MNSLTLRKLEYEKIIEKLVAECSSNLGKEKAKELQPSTDVEQVRLWLEETTEGVTIRRNEPQIPLGGILDVRRQLRKVEIGGILEPEEFLQILDTIVASRKLNAFLVGKKKNYEAPRVEWWAKQLVVVKELEDAINDVIAPEGEVRDTASLELSSIRKKITTLQNKIKEKLESLVRSEHHQKHLQDALVTIRNDRYVVPVKQEYRSQIPGIVHDQSASGATVFIEPMAVVEMNNDLRKAFASERDEVIRVLGLLSQQVAQWVEDLMYNLEVLAQLDFIFAKARLSEKMTAVEPHLLSKPQMEIIKGRHPLIDPKQVVPLSLTLGEEFDSLIITGPNTGGKTVTIKTAGLFVLMTQAGLHIPAEVGSKMGVFEQVFADIGDEQSIEQSLSTFSSHMSNIVKILKQANHKSLVLLDELGAGTDPSEGAALAISILDYVLKARGKIIATTHYSELKAYAFDEPRVQNASVEFDVETLRPTYRLLIGVPGRSNAFEIAKKLGLEEGIIDHARSLISEEEKDVAMLIESLEANRIEAEKQRNETEEKLLEVKQQLLELEEEKAKIAASADKIKIRAEKEAFELLRDARRESEEIIKELKEIMKQEQMNAQSRAHELKKNLSEKENKIGKNLLKGPKVTKNKVNTVNIGDEVYVPKFTQKATVLSKPNNNGELQVQIGIMKVNVNIDELQATEKKKQHHKTGIGKIVTEKSSNIKSEIDLRGMMVDEALEYVDKYLDDAYLSGLGQVNIIHGKGTGALREAIKNMLKRHPHVKSYRLGGFNEGGAGCTIAELKK